VTILIIGSVLLGAILGRFFKVPVLAPAFALSLAMVVASSAYFGHSLLRTLLEFVVLITSLQIGYASGLLSRLIPSVSENAGEHVRACARTLSRSSLVYVIRKPKEFVGK
jgi:hypothetical protein